MTEQIPLPVHRLCVMTDPWVSNLHFDTAVTFWTTFE